MGRPGGALASRPIYFFWVVDCSGSMEGIKIGTVNHEIQEAIPDMRRTAEENPNAQLFIRTLKFSDGASWVTNDMIKIEDFSWEDLTAEGLTDMGQAFDLLAGQLSMPPMPSRALPPVIVLVSDGQPTDNYKPALERLLKLPWAKKSVRIAIAIGEDADLNVLEKFTRNKELVLKAGNPSRLAKLIRWASTVAASVSQPHSHSTSAVPDVPTDSDNPGIAIDNPPPEDIPDFGDGNDIQADGSF